MSTVGDKASVRSENWKVLRQLFPHVTVPDAGNGDCFLVSASRTGLPTLRVIVPGQGSVWVHSGFDPKAEGERLAAGWVRGKGLYIVLGIGLGYHVEALIQRIPEGSQVLIAEPDAELFHLAMASVPLTHILSYPGLGVAIGAESSFVDELRRINGMTPGVRPYICVHPTLARLNPGRYQRWQSAIRSEFSRALVDTATIIQWDLTWGRNTMTNLPRVLRTPPVNRLFGQFQGVPGIIVAAGPSLDLNVHELAHARGKAVIIAVGTALKALRAQGVEPDLVVSYDGSEANYRHFQGVAYDDIPLVFEPMIYPGIPQDHRGQQWVMQTNSNAFMGWLTAILESPGIISSGGSIATVALDLAVKLGCNPLVLVGQDLAFGNGRTHAQGTVYQDNRIQDVDTENSLVPPEKSGR